MNREIKFRAWDKNKRTMLYPCLIEFYGARDSLTGIQYYSGILGKTRHYVHKWNIELMQYTCLKDKNGVEIYEGDIIYFMTVQDDKRQFRKGTVHWSEPDGRWKVDYWSFGTEIYFSKVKIIGNIWEHPELLKGDNITNSRKDK